MTGADDADDTTVFIMDDEEEFASGGYTNGEETGIIVGMMLVEVAVCVRVAQKDARCFLKADVMLPQVSCSFARVELEAQARWRHGGILADAGEGDGGAGGESAEVSALKHYEPEGFTVERLMHFATALEHDVVI